MGETALREPAALPLRRGRSAGTTDAMLSSGNLLAAFSSCCLIPFALFSLGVSGAWIGNLTALEPYKLAFFAASLALIGTGSLRVHRRSHGAACQPDTACADPRADRFTKAALWAASALTVAGMAFPWLFSLVAAS